MKNLLSKLMALSLKKKIITGLVVAIIAASGITTGIVVNRMLANDAKQVTAKEKAKGKEKKPKKVEEPVDVQWNVGVRHR